MLNQNLSNSTNYFTCKWKNEAPFVKKLEAFPTAGINNPSMRGWRFRMSSDASWQNAEYWKEIEGVLISIHHHECKWRDTKYCSNCEKEYVKIASINSKYRRSNPDISRFKRPNDRFHDEEYWSEVEKVLIPINQHGCKGQRSAIGCCEECEIEKNKIEVLDRQYEERFWLKFEKCYDK